MIETWVTRGAREARRSASRTPVIYKLFVSDIVQLCSWHLDPAETRIALPSKPSKSSSEVDVTICRCVHVTCAFSGCDGERPPRTGVTPPRTPSAHFAPRLVADRHAGAHRLRRRHRGAVRASAPRRRRLRLDRLRSPSRRRVSARGLRDVTVAPPRPVRERARLVPSRGVRARRDTCEARGRRPRRVARRVRGVRRRRVGGFGRAGRAIRDGRTSRARDDDDVRDDARGGVVPERPAFGG